MCSMCCSEVANVWIIHSKNSTFCIWHYGLRIHLHASFTSAHSHYHHETLPQHGKIKGKKKLPHIRQGLTCMPISLLCWPQHELLTDLGLKVSAWIPRLWTLVLDYVHQSTYCVVCMWLYVSCYYPCTMPWIHKHISVQQILLILHLTQPNTCLLPMQACIDKWLTSD